MKKNILFGTCAAALLLLGGCDYNEDNFPGFDEYTHAKDVRNDTVTLAKADYKKVAELDANVSLALSKDPDGESFVRALEQMGKNGYFTEDAQALWYLPAYVESLYPYLSDNSKILVNYQNAENLPAYLTDFNGAKDYGLKSEDYQVVWGDKVSASFLSPSTVNQIPAVLKAAMNSAKSGDMLLVNYAYSETEPSIGGGSTENPEVNYTKVADVLGEKTGVFTVKGEVVAVNAKSFMVSDGTGIIRVYKGNLPTCAVGDVVEVSGEIEFKQELTRFRSKAEFKVLERKTSFAYPAPKSFTPDDLVAYVEKPNVQYVTYEGTLVKSSSNYNVKFGNETVIGGVTDPLFIDDNYIDKPVVVTGYLAGVSGSSTKYINMFATSVVLKGEAAPTPIGVALFSKADTYTVKGVVSGLHTRGFMVTDGTGDILVYQNQLPTVKVADVVTVTGKTSPYNGLMQFNKDAEVTVVAENSKALTNMVPQMFAAAEMDAYVAAPRVVYAAFDAKLSIKDSGKGFNYYNLTLEGSEAKLSFSYADDKAVDPALNGKKVSVVGYFMGVNSSGYVQVMMTSVAEATAATTKAFGITRATVEPNTSALYRYDGKAWSAYEPDAEDVELAVLQPADYRPMGYNSISKPSEVLPVYLSKAYPYAKKDDIKTAVYYYYADKVTSVAATEFQYDGTTWIETRTDMPASMMFVKSDGKWLEAKVYYESTLMNGEDGGFTVQDIELDGLSKVWSIERSYGWKGSGYSGGNKKTESWIVSPEIKLEKAASPVLKFEAAVNHLKDQKLGDYIAVKISTDYADDVKKATWKDLTMEGWPDGTSWDFVEVTPVSLADYRNQTIRIAFQYKSDEKAAPTVEIRRIAVQE